MPSAVARSNCGHIYMPSAVAGSNCGHIYMPSVLRELKSQVACTKVLSISSYTQVFSRTCAEDFHGILSSMLVYTHAQNSRN